MKRGVRGGAEVTVHRLTANTIANFMESNRRVASLQPEVADLRFPTKENSTLKGWQKATAGKTDNQPERSNVFWHRLRGASFVLSFFPVVSPAFAGSTPGYKL